MEMNKEYKITILLNAIVGSLNIIIGILRKDFFQIISGTCLFIISDFIIQNYNRNRIIETQDRLILKYSLIIDEMAKDRAEIGEPQISAEAIKNFYFGKVKNDE